MRSDLIEVEGLLIVVSLDDELKRRGPGYRSRKAQAADPCPCGHPRVMHMQDGGCRASACDCDIPAAAILPFAA